MDIMNATSLSDLVWSQRDPRLDGWPLMDSVWPTVSISAAYILFVKVIGPKLMENRKPFELKNTIIAYNLFQVLFNGWLCQRVFFSGWHGDYSFWCEPVDTSDSVNARNMLACAWWFYISKYPEMIDTLFFVARKKYGNVSNLHVIHHAVMPLVTWELARFAPGGHESFGGLFNTFVHVVMYFYYFLAALGPAMRPYLWWKKYLTMLQLAQFTIVVLHSALLLYDNSCGFPLSQAAITSLNSIFFFVLFSHFYGEAYSKKDKKRE